MHQQLLLADAVAVVALDLDIVHRLDNNTRRILRECLAASPYPGRCNVAIAALFLPGLGFFPGREFSLPQALSLMRFPKGTAATPEVVLFYPAWLVKASIVLINALIGPPAHLGRVRGCVNLP